MKMIAITEEEGLEICKNGLWFSDEEARKMYFATDENRDGVWIFNTEKERAEAIEKHNNPMPDPRTEEIDGKYYDVYFERWNLRVSGEGELMNPDVLHIIEFEYDDDTDEVTSCRRVDPKGNVLETDPDLTYFEHSGNGDDASIKEALGRFEDWLENHLEWRVDVAETRYQPAEYICIGVEDCVPDRKWDWWDNGGKEQTLYGL